MPQKHRLWGTLGLGGYWYSQPCIGSEEGCEGRWRLCIVGMEKAGGTAGAKACECEISWCVRGNYKLFGIRDT